MRGRRPRYPSRFPGMEAYVDAVTGETAAAEGGRISLELEPCGCRILIHTRDR